MARDLANGDGEKWQGAGFGRFKVAGVAEPEDGISFTKKSHKRYLYRGRGLIL
jgi:hypothetical protein